MIDAITVMQLYNTLPEAEKAKFRREIAAENSPAPQPQKSVLPPHITVASIKRKHYAKYKTKFNYKTTAAS